MAIDLVAVLRLDDQMTKNLNQAALAASAGFAAIGAAAIASINQFVDFDTAIRKTGAIAGANANELNLLSEAALDLGASTSKSATEVANAMTELAAGGMDVNSVLGAMPGIIAASEASGESLAVASETVAAALNMWSMEAEESAHVADVLAMAANMSAAGIMDMSYAFKYAGAPAAALGISLEETAAAIGLMTNNGIDGSSAGTALRAALFALLNPSKENEKAMKALGFTLTDSAGEMKSISEIIRDMITATNGMTDAQKTATVASLVGTEASTGFLALMKSGPAEIDKMTAALENSGGAAAETAKQMMGGIGGAIEEMKGAIETLAIRVGERLAPAIETFARLVAGMDFTPFINMVGLIGDAAGYVAKIISDNWSTIVKTLKPLVVIAGAIATSFLLIGGAAAIFVALSTAIAFISGPVAAVALGVGVLVGAFVAFYDKMTPIKDFIETFKQVLDGGMFTGILERDQNAVALAVKLGNGVKNAFEKVSDFIATFKQLVSGGMMTGILERDEGAVAMAVNIFNALKNAFNTVSSFIQEKIVQLTPAFLSLKETLGQVWTTISDIFANAWSIIGPILGGLWDLLQIVGSAAVILFNNILVPALGFVSQLFSTLWAIAQPILTLLSGLFEVLGAVIKWVWDNVLAPLVEFIATGFKNAFDNLSEALEIVAGWFDKISGFANDAKDKLGEFAEFIAGIQLPDWLRNGISTTVSFVGEVIGSKPNGSHYHGLDSVPYDGYTARLHRGETVLTAQEAQTYREAKSSATGGGGGVTITGNTFHVRQESDIEAIAYELAQLLEKERLQHG